MLTLHFKRVFLFRDGHFGVKTYSVLSIFIPLFVRALPEVFMGSYLVGFDTIAYYVPTVWRWVNHSFSFWEFFGSAPLIYFLTYVSALAGVPLTVSLKILPPVLYGVLSFAIFSFAVKSLEWPCRRGLFVSMFSTLYFVGLRVSWDMLRCVLGLIFLFFLLRFLHECLRGFRWRLFGVLSVLGVFVVLAHQLVSVILFVIVSVLVLENFMKGLYSFAFKLFAACVPAFVLFIVIVYADYVVLPGYNGDFVVMGLSDWLNLMGYSSTVDMTVHTICFLFFCYLPILPLIFMGARRFRGLEFKVWVAWCFVGMLLPFFSPFAPLGYRWVLLLNFPFAFFAIEGFRKINRRFFKGFFAVFLSLLSFSFVFLPAEMAFPYFNFFLQYFPSSMLQNSVSLRDCEDVVKALKWVDDNVGYNSVLMVHDAFYGWALLYTGKVEILRYGYADPESFASNLTGKGYRRLYLVWWIPGLGWHGQACLPSSFTMVYRAGRMAVYEFKASL